MSNTIVIEEERGTSYPVIRSHDGYWAGDPSLMAPTTPVRHPETRREQETSHSARTSRSCVTLEV